MPKKLELWPIEKLRPYESNSRTHSSTQIDKVMASMIEDGFTNPILVDSKARILAGHGRLEAAKKLRLTEVPVVVLDHLSDEQKRAYVIADNKLAELAGWDNAILSSELKDLKDLDYDLDSIGFSDEELRLLTNDSDLGYAEQKGALDKDHKIVENFLQNEFRIIVLCRDENIQAELFEEMSKREGLECKIS